MERKPKVILFFLIGGMVVIMVGLMINLAHLIWGITFGISGAIMVSIGTYISLGTYDSVEEQESGDIDG